MSCSNKKKKKKRKRGTERKTAICLTQNETYLVAVLPKAVDVLSTVQTPLNKTNSTNNALKAPREHPISNSSFYSVNAFVVHFFS